MFALISKKMYLPLVARKKALENLLVIVLPQRLVTAYYFFFFFFFVYGKELTLGVAHTAKGP